MPDNWSFVAAAYGLTALVLLVYWRRLVRKERELGVGNTTRTGAAKRGAADTTTGVADRGVAGTTPSVAGRSVAGTTPSVAERSREPSGTAHPRLKRDADSSLP